MSSLDARIISRNDYSAFLSRVPHPVFHRLEWLDAIESAQSVRLTLLGLFSADDLVGVSPVLERRFGPFRIFGAPLRKSGMPAATPFCSPATLSTEAIPALRTWMLRSRVRYLQLSLRADCCNDSAPAEREELLSNLELNLARPLQSIWDELSELPRRCIRKAVRAGVRVHWLVNPELLSIQQRLVHATYDAQGLRPNISVRLYAELFARRASNSLRVLAAAHEGHVVATIWCFHDNEKCYYWDAAALSEARDLNANHVLVWTLIRWAHRRGFTTLDFVGTSVGGRAGSRPGIGRFKQSMGARAVEYRILYWHTPALRLALAAYRRVQYLLAKLRKK